MKERTCCFTGHREIPERDYNRLKQKTKNAIIELIEKGVIYFGAGGARGFDTIAAETVLELKNDYPQIKLILVLPCPDQTKGWKEGDIRKYNIIKENADIRAKVGVFVQRLFAYPHGHCLGRQKALFIILYSRT